MEITYEHITRLCAIVAQFYDENDYYPVIISSPQMIQSLCDGYTKYGPQVKVASHFRVFDFYNRHKGSNTYINKQTPEGLIIFKQSETIITHRIFDLPSDESKPKKLIKQNVTGTIFRHINFDNEI